MEKDIPKLLLALVSRLLGDKGSDISRGLLNCFIDSTFFQTLAVFFQKRMLDLNATLEDRYRVANLGIKVVSDFLDFYPSRLELF